MQRYQPILDCIEDECRAEMEPYTTGDYVEYADAQDALAEKDRTLAEWKAAWETENAAVKKAEREIAELKAEIDEALKLKQWADDDIRRVGDLLDLLGAPTSQESGFLYSVIGRLSKLTAQIVGDSWAAKINMLTAEIEQWKRVVVTHVEEIERLKAEAEQWKDLAFAQGMKLKMGEAPDET